jgi:ABC-type amino acid transport substrate-binding protein
VDVQMARVGHTPDATPASTHVSREAAAVSWPWPGASVGEPERGRYEWRVRDVGAATWSPWAAFALYPSLLDRVVDEKIFRVGTEATAHVPFLFTDRGTNKPAGFDLELGEAIAAELGVRFERVPHDGLALFKELDSRRVDVVLASVSLGKEQPRPYALSKPYVHTALVTVVRAGVRLTPPGTGKQIAVLTHVAAVDIAKRHFPGATIHEVDSLDNGFSSLAGGSVDAVVCVDYIARAHREVDGVKLQIDPTHVADSAIAIAMPSGDDALVRRIDEALTSLEQSGRLPTLRKKYGL